MKKGDTVKLPNSPQTAKILYLRNGIARLDRPICAYKVWKASELVVVNG